MGGGSWLVGVHRGILWHAATGPCETAGKTINFQCTLRYDDMTTPHTHISNAVQFCLEPVMRFKNRYNETS